MKSFPPVSADLLEWAKSLTRSLSFGWSQLEYKDSDSRATQDGVILWDAAADRAVVSLDGAWVPLTSKADGAYGHLAADYTLTSTTAGQKLFNWSTNGALTLATGRYRFNTTFQITGMSATSGNGEFRLVGAGTATTSGIMYHVMGEDATLSLTAGTMTRTGSVTSTGQANMVSATVGTALFVTIQGMFNVTAAGTIIPSIALTTAAAGAVKAGSYFECRRIGDTGDVTSGAWS